ncbi:MAG TPA: Hsp20/alpha crystallin family protein [candidate division Zixibacteria bacterium]|nr:Hsp20/alpha crystallin family protein [candidate division Zixibacteria bacterium]
MSNEFDEFRIFEENMNRMFEKIWGIPVNRSLLLPGERTTTGAIETYRKPFIDLVDTDKEVIATVEMPGLDKGDIKIDLTEDKLEISAETKREEEKKEKGYLYKERRSGSYFRMISLPSSIDSDNSKASYNNGILQITMPKTEIKKKKPLKVE